MTPLSQNPEQLPAVETAEKVEAEAMDVDMADAAARLESSRIIEAARKRLQP